MEYDQTKEYQVPKDRYAPVSVPENEYQRLPQGYKVVFIDTEDKLDQMKILIGQKYIGVDAEWRPDRPSWGIMPNGPATL